MSSSKVDFIKRQRTDCDDYNQSVVGLYAFASSCTWDSSAGRPRPGSRVCIPRKMTLVQQDGIPDEREVTPDGVVQVSVDYGVVAEMKKHFPTRDHAELFEQVHKYAMTMKGWWTDSSLIAAHDVVLLTHIASATDACDAYDSWLAQGNQLGRPFAIVEFGYLEQGQLWFLLRRRTGQLSDAAHDADLRRGKQLGVEVLTDVFSQRKFMENEPPLVLMMVLVYTYALPLFIREEEFKSGAGTRHPIALASTSKVREALQQQFVPTTGDEREFTLPRAGWVRQALDSLVRLGLGQRPDSVDGEYRIAIKKPRTKDLIEYFSDRLFVLNKETQQAQAEEQRGLFE